MAATDRKPQTRLQTIPKSATTSWLKLGEQRRPASRSNGSCGLKGWQPCPSQDKSFSQPMRSESSPIAQRIGLFEKLSRRHNDENVVVSQATPLRNTARLKEYKDRIHSSIQPLSPSFRLSSGNVQAHAPTESKISHSSIPGVDKQGLRQRAAAVRERLSSISSSVGSNSTTHKGCQKARQLSHHTGSSDCVALLSPDSIESLTSDHPHLRPTYEPSSPGATLRKNPPPDGHVRLSSASWFRRRVSRSDQPTIARAQCVLEQPQPVRGSEVRRLASMCKERVSGRRTRGSE